MPSKQKGFKGSRGQAVKGKENNSNQTTPEFCIPIYPRCGGVGCYNGKNSEAETTKHQTLEKMKSEW
jgi:hypothetical protein